MFQMTQSGYLGRAQDLLKSGNTADAILELRRAISSLPMSLEQDLAQLRIGQILECCNDTSAALLEYEAIASRGASPCAALALLSKGGCFLTISRPEKAIEVFLGLVESFPDSPETLVALGHLKLLLAEAGRRSERQRIVHFLDSHIVRRRLNADQPDRFLVLCVEAAHLEEAGKREAAKNLLIEAKTLTASLQLVPVSEWIQWDIDRLSRDA
jgi:tetratricopeptide (TPR) repeat protein